jgi:hypothetical protein
VLPFFSFQIELGPQWGGSRWLRMTGNSEVKDFIDVELVDPLLASRRIPVTR